MPLIEVPADAVRLILQFNFGQSDTTQYGVSWYDTRAQQVALGLKWAVRWSGGTFSEFRRIAGDCGRADLVQEGGLWEYLWHGRPSPAKSFTVRNAGAISFGVMPPMTALVSRLKVSWAPVYVSNSYAKSQELASPNAARLDDRQGRRFDVTDATLTLDLPFVNDDQTALTIGKATLATRDRQMVTGSLVGGWDALALAKGDSVTVDSPVLKDWGGTALWFRVLGKAYALQTGAGVTVTLLGLPASFLVLTATVSLRLSHAFTMDAEVVLKTMLRRVAEVAIGTKSSLALTATLGLILRPTLTLMAELAPTGAWPTPGGAILLETGDFLLLED
jgi:hypothetical protein